MNRKKLRQSVEEAVAKASFSLRKDVIDSLKSAYLNEKNKLPRKALNWIIKNAQIAKANNLAICQDTGLPIVFIEVGKNITISGDIIDEIKTAVESSYKKNYLRQSIVDPLNRNKPSYNNGVICHVDFFSKIKGLHINVFPKGFGCENKSRLKMFNPTVGLEDIEDFLLESVREAGPEACPPFVVGVGIGGTSDFALFMAKKALLEKINKKNPDPQLDILERKILKKINSLGIGPMGFGGKTTCLAVKIKKAPTHIAGLPIGVNISCHALRSARISI